MAFWPFDAPCRDLQFQDIFARGNWSQAKSFRGFQRWALLIEERLGLTRAMLLTQLERLTSSVGLKALSRGTRAVAEKDGVFRTRGGWGADLLWSPDFLLWEKVTSSFPDLKRNYVKRLGFPEAVMDELFTSDLLSMHDSGWVTAELSGGRAKDRPIFSTTKVTYFDGERTPISPWPIDYVSPDPWIPHRENVGWGLLPLERHTGFRVAEHQEAFVNPGDSPAVVEAKLRVLQQHAQKMNYLVAHMRASIGAGYFNKAELQAEYSDLLAFRQRHFPGSTLRVGEIGRLSIPALAGPQAKSQLLFGLLALIADAPIDVFYLEAPHLKGANPEALKGLYESLGFSLIHTAENEGEGLQQRSYIMRQEKGSLIRHLVESLASKSAHLSEEQRTLIEKLGA